MIYKKHLWDIYQFLNYSGNIGSLLEYLPRVISLSNRGKPQRSRSGHTVYRSCWRIPAQVFFPAVRYSLWRRTRPLRQGSVRTEWTWHPRLFPKGVQSHFSASFLVLMGGGAPLRQPCPKKGAGAHAIHLYYRGIRSLVIQRHCNRGATSVRGEAPGASVFLVLEQEHFFDLNFGTLL